MKVLVAFAICFLPIFCCGLMGYLERRWRDNPDEYWRTRRWMERKEKP